MISEELFYDVLEVLIKELPEDVLQSSYITIEPGQIVVRYYVKDKDGAYVICNDEVAYYDKTYHVG